MYYSPGMLAKVVDSQTDRVMGTRGTGVLGGAPGELGGAPGDRVLGYRLLPGYWVTG